MTARRAAVIAMLAVGPALSQESAPSPDKDEIKIERIVSGLKFAEGPAWSKEGFLVLSDIPAETMYRVQIADDGKLHRTVWREHSGGANGNAFDAQGRLYTCEAHNRRVVRTDKKGRIETLAEKWEEKRLNAPNDIVVRHDGHVYFTDPAFSSDVEKRELDFYGIFHIAPKGELALVAKWHTRPNGIALSPDGRTLYVADSDEHTVHAFDVDKSGSATNDRVVIRDIDGVPDGLRTDEKGSVYVAANGIHIYSPDGHLRDTLRFAERPSNMTFGDPDFQTLYVTAQDSVFRVRLNVKGTVPY